MAPVSAGPLILADPDAERSVIGSLLIDPGATSRLRSMLKPDDFWEERNQWIYAAALELENERRHIDWVTVGDRLKAHKKFDELHQDGGDYYLASILSENFTSAYAEHYAEIVARLSDDRAAVELAGKITRAAYARTGEGLKVARELVHNVATGNSMHGNMRSMTEIVHSALDTASAIEQARVNGTYYDLYTGIPQVDKYLVGGLFRGDVFVLAGQTGSRKSVIAHMAAHYVSKVCGSGVLMFSTEMPGEQLAARAIAAQTGISSRMIQRGLMTQDQWGEVSYRADDVACDWFLVEDLVMHSEFVRERVEEAEFRLDEMGRPLRLIVVDYLQMIRDPKSRDRRIDVDALLHDLKGISKTVPIIVVSSIRRTENLYTKPSLRDALESSFIEFTATFGAVTWRDEMGIYYIEFQKSRDGATGMETLPPTLPNQAWFNIKFQPPPSPQGIQA